MVMTCHPVREAASAICTNRNGTRPTIPPTMPAPSPLLGRLRRAGRGVLDLLLPPRCVACRDAVQPPGGLCLDCWQGLAFIAGPVCRCCGLPFDEALLPPAAFDTGAGPLAEAIICPACIAAPPRFAAARAALVYDDASRKLILPFKHADRLDLAPTLAALLHSAALPLLPGVDLIVPVPLHWTRLLRRRYNQSAVLARHIARRSRHPVCLWALRRRRRTPVLGPLGRGERARALAGAITIDRRAADRVRDATVLLVDDVLTSGSTAEACAAALRRAGAVEVRVATIARVLRAT